MTSNGQTGPALSAASPAGPDTRQDPAMKALFRMSRTAGVGLQDYAAVNVLAVVGLLLGLASFLAYAAPDSVPMLIVPAVAVVICVIAAVQIVRSNRTQTGLPLAIVGLLLAVAFAATNVAAHVRTSARDRAYHAELNVVAGKLLNASTSQGVGGAYDLFDARFKESVKAESFARLLQPRLQHLFAGKPVTSIGVGDLVVYETDDSGMTSAMTLLVLRGDDKLPNGEPFTANETVEFRRDKDSNWKIHAIPGWFGEPKKPGA